MDILYMEHVNMAHMPRTHAHCTMHVTNIYMTHRHSAPMTIDIVSQMGFDRGICKIIFALFLETILVNLLAPS